MTGLEAAVIICFLSARMLRREQKPRLQARQHRVIPRARRRPSSRSTARFDRRVGPRLGWGKDGLPMRILRGARVGTGLGGRAQVGVEGRGGRNRLAVASLAGYDHERLGERARQRRPRLIGWPIRWVEDPLDGRPGRQQGPDGLARRLIDRARRARSAPGRDVESGGAGGAKRVSGT